MNVADLLKEESDPWSPSTVLRYKGKFINGRKYIRRRADSTVLML
jgi:hypothetical protein